MDQFHDKPSIVVVAVGFYNYAQGYLGRILGDLHGFTGCFPVKNCNTHFNGPSSKGATPCKAARCRVELDTS